MPCVSISGWRYHYDDMRPFYAKKKLSKEKSLNKETSLDVEKEEEMLAKKMSNEVLEKNTSKTEEVAEVMS